MKIRNGFVSNSSSSSFILGIGKVNDIKKFREYLEKKNIKDEYYLTLTSKSEIMTQKPWNIDIKGDLISLESFNYDSVTLDMSKLSPLDIVVLYDFIGNEGDSDFWIYDEYQYNIDFSFFNENERKIFNMFKDPESGIDIETSKLSFGTGRNG